MLMRLTLVYRENRSKAIMADREVSYIFFQQTLHRSAWEKVESNPIFPEETSSAKQPIK
jgi:hypothetical protein